ncbi:hypothetical protein RJ640_025323 [Escallonia rubra]|uniref:FAR1 domain-containing protein n=1 Tax=Escallonia rubra TaxID=112253 RepID=A0AA88QIT5_9ASTE|nr:hypothetical protein RJ640_025323 [Escallonia rubra]
MAVDEHPYVGDDREMIESSNGKESDANKGNANLEPYVGMEFESEEAAKVFYDTYATHLGFIMRVDAFRRSMRDGKVVWRRLVCNKEGFRKCKPRRSENRKPRAITREGCKAMIVVKKEKTGKWVVTRFVTEHNHPLVVAPPSNRRTVLLSQTPVSALNLDENFRKREILLVFASSLNVNQYLASFSLLPPLYTFQDEKDVKIRELTAELQRERKRSAAIQEQLDMVLKDMEEHSNHLSRNIDDIVQSVKEIESKRVGR